MNRPPINSSAALRSAAAQARYDRADLLLGINEGVLTLADAIEQASRFPAIRRLSLRQVLLHLPGIGETAIRRIEARYHDVLGSTAADRRKRLLLAAIVDERRGGRAVIALADAVPRERKLLPTTRRSLVPAGFPFAELISTPVTKSARRTTNPWGDPLPQPVTHAKPAGPRPSDPEPAVATTPDPQSPTYASVAEARTALGPWAADLDDEDFLALIKGGV